MQRLKNEFKLIYLDDMETLCTSNENKTIFYCIEGKILLIDNEVIYNDLQKEIKKIR